MEQSWAQAQWRGVIHSMVILSEDTMDRERETHRISDIHRLSRVKKARDLSKVPSSGRVMDWPIGTHEMPL
jgi:hypothetical protein